METINPLPKQASPRIGRALARFRAKDVAVVFGPGAIPHRPAYSCIFSIPTV
jgi:hypothetical protein